MKKALVTITLSCLTFISFSQQVPDNAAFVIQYNGSRFDESLPIDKINQYKFVQNIIQKEMNYKGIFPLDRTGIDFTKTSLQYAIVTDSAVNFLTEITISNLSDFLELVQKNYKAELKTTRQNDFEYLKISDHKYLGWNDKTAVLAYVHTTREKYEYYYPSEEETEAVNLLVDSIINARQEAKKYIEDKPVTEKKKKKGQESVAPPEPDWSLDEEQYLRYDLQDSINAALSSKWYAERDSIKIAKRKTAAIDALINAFDKKNAISVSELPGYDNVTEQTAHVSVWMNYGNLYNQLITQMMLFGVNQNETAASVAEMSGKASKESGYILGLNLFFEKEQIRVNQITFAPNSELTNLSNQIYKAKQSKSLTAHINPDCLGYLSVSFNSEAMIHYYYKMIKDYLKATPFTAEFGDLINLYVDLLEISIDEKAISELAPGNMIFVLHKLGSKEVTYTTYEYDEEFNQKEVIKKKTEPAPDFTISFATKRADFMQKLVSIPVKYAEKGGYQYQQTGQYFTLTISSERSPINEVYFGVKKDQVIITTSKEVVDNAFGGKSYTLTPETKKHIFANNFAGTLHTKRVLQAVGPEFSTETNRKIRKLLEENLGNLTMESNIKKGIAQTSYIMKIDGNHENSFEFIFNITDAIRGIMEADKNEKETF